MKLFYKEYGSGEPLIILHGLLGASGNWHTLSRNVFSEHFHVYTVDQRNHGRSPHGERFDYPAMANDVLELMDDQGIDAAHILGHSMGGKTAMFIATSHPDRVRKLIVADMAPRSYESGHDYILDALAHVDPADFESRDEIAAALGKHIGSPAVRQFLLKNLTLDKESGQYDWQMNLDAIRDNYDKVNVALPEDARFDGPTLFVRGDKSDYVSDADREEIEQHFPKAVITTVKDAGHWLHAEQPDVFGQTVTKFLRASG